MYSTFAKGVVILWCAAGLLSGLAIAAPVQVVIAFHGQALVGETDDQPGVSVHGVVEHDARSGCAAHSFAGNELQKARALWSGRHAKPYATVNIPTDNATAAYAVRGGQLYRKAGPRKSKALEDKGFAGDNAFIEYLLWRTLRRFPDAPDADLVVSYGDVESPQSANIEAPVFTFSAKRGRKDAKVDLLSKPSAIGFPNPYLVDQAMTLDERKAPTGAVSAHHLPWASKHPKAYWRGTLTAGNVIANNTVSKQVRVVLAEIAADRTQDFDIGYTDIDLKQTWSESVKRDMQNAYQRAAHTDTVDFLDVLPQYKYLINVDGVSVAWRGMALLAAGSVMMLQSSERSEFFFKDLQPWVHYVPLKQDLSDLLETLDYLRLHDDAASRIAKAGQDFAYSKLTLPGLECYVLDALNFMSQVSAPVPLAELSSLDFKLVPEPDAHLQIPPAEQGSAIT